MAEKVTVMVLKVDLQCSCCYKKIKRLLCQFPQVRDQRYDDKQNQVIITVVCCSPEKFRDKLCCKGRKVIKSIDIIEPPKPKPPVKPKEPEKPPEKPKEPEKPLETPKEPEKPPEKPKQPEKPPEKPKHPCPPHPCPPIHVEVRCPPYPGRGCCGPCSEGYPGGPCYHEHERSTQPPPLPSFPGRGCCGPCSEGYPGGPCYHEHERHTQPPPLPLYPGRGCCGPCSEGYLGGPCYHEHERSTLAPPPPPQPYHDGYRYGGGKGCNVSRCDYYFSEENPQGCMIM